MKATKWILALAVAAAAPVTGQNTEKKYNGHGYAVVGLGVPDSGKLADLISFGGGGEGFLWKGLTIGSDLNYVMPRMATDEGIGMWNLTGGWHFINRTGEQKVIPFITGGYSLAFRESTLSLYNYGGGVNYWFQPRVGVRVEVRDYRHNRYGRFNTELRFGVLFR
jgi:hypothetical protein